MICTKTWTAILAISMSLFFTSFGVGAGTVTPPPPNGQFDYQLGGAYPPAAGVEIVVRDRLASPAAGKYTICYINAFQTQTDDARWWLDTHPELLLKHRGASVRDQDWPDELLLDTSTPQKRSALLSIIGPWIDQCAHDGFNAVEADNLDSWTRSNGRLRKQDNMAFAALLVGRAHAAGLAIGQKNAAELAPLGPQVLGFDFAIAEECQIWSECDDYIAAYGARVYEIEYNDTTTDGEGAPVDPLTVFEAACKTRGRQISVIYRDRAVVPETTPGYDYRSC